MKKYHSYITRNMQRIFQCGLAALVFFSALPAFAQDEAEATEEEEVVVAPVRRTVPVKKYEMVEIKGKVTDAATKAPLAGAQIRAYNNNLYTAMSDEDGTFTISVPVFVTSLSTVLDGYDMIQTPINGRSSGLEIALYSSKYSDIYTTKTSPVQYSSTKDFEQSTAISVDQEVANRLTSQVRSASRSAIPGMGVSMFINGFNSLNANSQPLIVLDGVVLDVMYSREMLHQGYYDNALASISMDDIESVQVLKNGTAIYGAKGANGVILINTKRNTSMATRIDANISVGVEFLPRLVDVMDATQYRAYASDLLGTTSTKLTDIKFLSNDPSYYYYNMYHNNTDWSKEVYDEALTQNYGIHIQGGDEVANYNLSVGYVMANSTLKKNDYDRFNIRFNTDILLNKWFSTRFDASFSNINRNLRDDGFPADYATQTVTSLSYLAMAKSPFLSPYAFSTDGKVSDFIADADDYLDEIVGTSASLANPKALLVNGEAKNKNDMSNSMINIAVSPKWQPTRNFSLTERFSYTMNNFNESLFLPMNGMPRYTVQDNGQVENGKQTLYTKHNAVFSDTRADWAIDLGAHRLDVFGGIRFMNDTYTETGLLANNTPNDKRPNNASDYRETKGVDDEWNSLTYYANVDYNFRETYYVQAALAMETSSRFGKETKAGMKMFGTPWAVFPSVNVAWVATNESWFRPSNFLNKLKVNGGFEINGNDGIDPNATYTYFSSTRLIYNTSGLMLGNIGNTKLRWEKTTRFNVGLDMNLLNNRVNLMFNYFFSKTNNLLTLSSLSYVSGMTQFWTNDGAMKNNGFDVGLSAKVVNLNNFKFELGATMGHYKNEITALPDGQNEIKTNLFNGTILTKVGQPAGVFYGYKTNGVYSTSGEATAAGLGVEDETGAIIPFGAGDMKIADLDGNKKINENDMSIIGDPNPDVFGRIFANFFIGKHWAVNINMNYCLGNDVYNFQRSVLENGGMFLNQTTNLTNRWMAEGQITDVPRATFGDPMGNSRFSDRWIEDGSFLKLKNVTVSYNIPLRSEFIQGLTVWAAGNNLLTFTKYLGNDPEVSAGNGVLYQGIDRGVLPFGRSFTLGVKINL